MAKVFWAVIANFADGVAKLVSSNPTQKQLMRGWEIVDRSLSHVAAEELAMALRPTLQLLMDD